MTGDTGGLRAGWFHRMHFLSLWLSSSEWPCWSRRTNSFSRTGTRSAFLLMYSLAPGLCVLPLLTCRLRTTSDPTVHPDRLIKLLTWQILTGYQPCARHCFRHWRSSHEAQFLLPQNSPSPCAGGFQCREGGLGLDVGWGGYETGLDLGPFTAVLTPAQTPPQATKCKETIRD